MPFISDAASAIKSRFGFHDQAAGSTGPIPSVRSTPNLAKSASRENLSQASAVRSIRDCFDDGDDGGGSCGGIVGNSSSAPSQSFELCEDPAFWKDHNVQVIIRIRPLSSNEISLQGHTKCVRQESSQTVTWTGPPESRFTFDLVADENVSQEKLFKVAGVPMVDNCMGGYNSCMFAYGQTGSGKTHTMLGDIEGGTRRHSVNCGMIPRVFECLFSRIQKEKETRRDEKLKFTCKCSFLEIYNEQILDLLDPSSVNLQLREDVKKGVYVESLKEVEVASARDVLQQLIQGATNRKVAATNMNLASSRSHSVFTCVIESKWESQGVTHHRFARLNLVDLAGSERQKSSGAEGERLKEATNINKSLSTLGLVIMNLVNISNGKTLHVPYRDSKLTFLLQDSLGGNSKTIIISNISPSSSCSLETLSTLKFAQRAKFIKNNAIINEDASGDVIAMRIQIQQLKKEVSRLQGLASGPVDTMTVSFPGSPGTFKWEGPNGSFSPLTSGKKMFKKKDYDAALVGAIRREKDKDIALQALAAENQAAMQLVKQREDEIQGLKMRLRFREAGIKRLEAVASRKISAETHLLKEKEEYLNEIEVLQTHVNRNQEVTRFAMENLRLKEEIRRLKSFCEDGERELMNEQVTELQNKLLEALDWKLMHESDSSKKKNSHVVIEELHGDDLLISNQEPQLPWQTSISEENEFLRIQAIQNQAEMDTLKNKFQLCLEEKEKLERMVNDLVTKLEEERSSRARKDGKQQFEAFSLSTDAPSINFSDQMELKAMVDTISAASQREAEAHETAIVLSKENDELRMKLKVLIDDNNKLIELYESASAECNNRVIEEPRNAQDGSEKEIEKHKVESLEQQLVEMHEENEKLMGLYERAMLESDELKQMLSSAEAEHKDRVIDQPENTHEQFSEEKELEVMRKAENLEQQLLEIHEENEKLMGLYERAILERDELKKVISSGREKSRESKRELDCDEKVVEVDGERTMDESPVSLDVDQGHEFKTLLDEVEDSIDERGSLDAMSLDGGDIDMSIEETNDSGVINMHNISGSVNRQQASRNLIDVGTSIEIDSPNRITDMVSEDLDSVRMKLENADKHLADSSRAVAVLSSLEKLVTEMSKLSREAEVTEDGINEKQKLFEFLKLRSSEIQERRDLVQKKLSALKYSLSSFSSSVAYFEKRESRATMRVKASKVYFDQKKKELAGLQGKKNEIQGSLSKIQQSEADLSDKLSCLVTKLEEENRKIENEKVLFAIDNIEKPDLAQKQWHLGGKASELLKSEEEKTSLQSEVKLSRERLGAMRREISDLKKKSSSVNESIEAMEMAAQKASKSAEETELAFRTILQEKNTLLEMRNNGRGEIESLIIEYHGHVFESDFNEAEMKELGEELEAEIRRVEELRRARALASAKTTEILDSCSENWCCYVSEKVEEELRSVRACVVEAKLLLLGEKKSLNKSL